jgi:hypothetical protein
MTRAPRPADRAVAQVSTHVEDEIALSDQASVQPAEPRLPAGPPIDPKGAEETEPLSHPDSARRTHGAPRRQQVRR